MVQDDKNEESRKEYIVISGVPELALRKAREESRKITNREIAEETGLSEATIGNWMKMKRMKFINVESLEILMRYFDCDIDEILLRVPVDQATQ